MGWPEKHRLFDIFIASIDEQKQAALQLREMGPFEGDCAVQALHLALLKAELAWSAVERHREEHGC